MFSQKVTDVSHIASVRITKFLEQNEQPSFLNIKGTLWVMASKGHGLIYSNHKQNDLIQG